MRRLSPCPSCRRHRLLSEGACPFCGAKLVVALAALAIAGCEPKPDVATVPVAAPTNTTAPSVVEPTPAPDAGVAPVPTTQPTDRPAAEYGMPPAERPQRPATKYGMPPP